jgi:putative heme-binding domain-containing protein
MISTASAAITGSGLALKDLGDATTQKRVVGGLIEQFFKRPNNTRDLELAIAALTGTAREGFSPQKNSEKLEAMTVAAREFWSDWYRQAYREPFIPRATTTRQVRSDEQIHAYLLSKESAGGNAVKGREVYLQVQCFACHGGVKAKQETLFGPSLAGVTKRLKRTEIADALVYPSKTVEDRFKATLIELADGESLSGIVTSESDKELTLVTPLGKVHTIPAKQVQERRKHNSSPMPQNLLSALSNEEIRDLLAFLEEVE